MAKLTKAVTKKLEKQVVNGMKLRDEAKRLEDDFKSMKEEGDEQIKPAMEKLGVDKFKAEGVGSVLQQTQVREKVDLKQLKKELLIAGVDADTVTSCFDMATSEYIVRYIQFNRAK